MSDSELSEEWSRGLSIFMIKIFYERNILKPQKLIKVKAKGERTAGCLAREDFNPRQKKTFKAESRQMSREREGGREKKAL